MHDTEHLSEYIIYRCIVGSRAYGLSHENSDTDRRGIYLPPANLHWSLTSLPGQLENKETDEVYWELEKFLTLALGGNPTILECLYSPIVEMATPLAQELIDMRSVFLSKRVYHAYAGYAADQFAKQERLLESKATIKWKHAMHLIRLLRCGITVLKEGYVPVEVHDHRDRLLSIKRGDVPWEEIVAWQAELQEKAAAAYDATSLPDKPDTDRVEAFLIKARRSMV